MTSIGNIRRAKRFRDLVRSQGRSFVWVAEKTGYSAGHVTRIARGEHPGTDKFWRSVQMVLGAVV